MEFSRGLSSGGKLTASRFLRLWDLNRSSNGGGEILESGGRDGISSCTTLSSASTQLEEGERDGESEGGRNLLDFGL